MKKKLIISSILCILLLLFLKNDNNIQNNNSQIKIHPYIDGKTSFINIRNTENGYSPYQIKHAYGIDNLNVTGKGQTIAIINAYGSSTIQEDFNTFNEKFNLSSMKLDIRYPDGKPNTNYNNWSIETSLDVEWVHAVAPDANIMLVIAKSESIEDLMSAVDYASKENAQVISMSWGTTEFEDESILNTHFSKHNTVYISSSGDNGAEVNWPAVSPNVLAVGGTILSLKSDGHMINFETAWSGSGGGISTYEFQPNYQKNYGIKSNNHRSVPDVSFCADPNKGVLIYSSINGWSVTGGTSLGAPCWAAYVALVNQNRNIPLSNVHEKLYQAASCEKYNYNFRDILLGNNGSSIQNHANIGYDYTTGLGSPRCNNLYNSLLD